MNSLYRWLFRISAQAYLPSAMLATTLVLSSSFTPLQSMIEISSHHILTVLYIISAPKMRAHRPNLSDVFCM